MISLSNILTWLSDILTLSNIFTIIQLLITPLTIVGVGYWVNITVRKKSQRSSIVIDYLQALQAKIHKFIDDAINAENLEQCTENLRSLSNEVSHLIELYTYLNEGKQNNVQKHLRLKSVLFDVKKYLTASGCKAEGENLERARQSSNELRRIIFDIVVSTCELQN